MKLTEQEILEDSLIATKFLMHNICKNQIEGSNNILRKILDENYKIASEHNFKIFEIMKQKSLYPVTYAQTHEIKEKIKIHKEMQKNLENKLSC